MPFVYPAPSPQPPKAPTSPASLRPASQPIPPTIMTTTMTNYSSLPPPKHPTSLQTVSQRMMEISKERAAKRKREREARQRGYFDSGSGSGTGNRSGSGSGGSMGDESIVSSAESSLESRNSQQPTSTSTPIVILTSPDKLVVGHIPIHHSSTHAVRNTGPAISSAQAQAQAQGQDLLHPQLRAHIPTPGRRTAADTSGPNTTGENIGPSISTFLSSGLVPTPTEEMDDDDDADLKRLMNQAENMLKIIDTPIAVGPQPRSPSQSQSQTNSQSKSHSASQAYVEDYGTSTGTASQRLGGMRTGIGAEVVDGRK